MSISDTIFPGINPETPKKLLTPEPQKFGINPGDIAPTPSKIDPDLAARNAAMEEQRRRSQFGRASTNPTGGLGDPSTPNLAAKLLLGY